MKTPTINIKVNKYFLIEADDYHDFDFIKNNINNIIDVDFEEIECIYDYRAVFWIGKKTKEVKDFIKLQKQNYDE